MLAKYQKNGLLNGIQASRNGPRVTHLVFADDNILFANADGEGSKRMKHMLKLYKESSGQKVNLNKSALYFNHNTRNECEGMIKNLFGVQSTENMGKYLRIPVLVAKDKKRAFQEIKERMVEIVKSWCNKTLSQGGKEVFIKSVLQAIPTYIMSCFLLPKSLSDELDLIIKNY